MIGGMVGNNSCGANSIVHGTTRDHLVSARGFLSDGSLGHLRTALARRSLPQNAMHPIPSRPRIYGSCASFSATRGTASSSASITPSRRHPPKHGYALDILDGCGGVRTACRENPSILCRLLAGSEGTLFFGVEFELNCEPLPPAGALLCAHFATFRTHSRPRSSRCGIGHLAAS
jgi:FAD/FMN-containing dehydrogenase